MSSTINSKTSSFFGKMLVVDLTSGKIEDREQFIFHGSLWSVSR